MGPVTCLVCASFFLFEDMAARLTFTCPYAHQFVACGTLFLPRVGDFFFDMSFLATYAAGLRGWCRFYLVGQSVGSTPMSFYPDIAYKQSNCVNSSKFPVFEYLVYQLNHRRSSSHDVFCRQADGTWLYSHVIRNGANPRTPPVLSQCGDRFTRVTHQHAKGPFEWRGLLLGGSKQSPLAT